MRKPLSILILLGLFWVTGVSAAWSHDAPQNSATPKNGKDVAEKPAPTAPEKPGQTDTQKPNPEETEKPTSGVPEKPIQKTHFQLMQISKRSLLIHKELRALEKETPTREVLSRKESLQIELEKLGENFEALATQIPKEEIPQDEPKQLGWAEELQSITKPALDALREITERPRKIDNLRATIDQLEAKIEKYETARWNVQELEAHKAEVPNIIENDKKNLITVREIQKKYKEDIAQLADRYNPEILSVELDEARRNLAALQASDKNLFSMAAESFGQFMSVRGRNLAVALGLFFGLWWFLNLFYRVLENKTRVLNLFRRSTRKLIKVSWQFFSILTAATASLFSLYFVDDWLLISLLLLVLVALGWTSRLFVPKFFRELKLILNLGTVREGERIFYEGLPWLIKEIGFHARLHNPRLDGGTILVQVSKLIGLSSRPFVKEEDWFPTHKGDWVIIGDIYGKVITQTPEQVILQYRSSSQVYLASEFIAQQPINLSAGFLLVIPFGLDYGVQDRICEEIPETFESSLKGKFSHLMESTNPVMDYIKVKFNRANASSLDLILLVNVNPGHGEDYYPLQRDLQKALVTLCNEHDLTIPFNQMTVTMADPGDRPSPTNANDA